MPAPSCRRSRLGSSPSSPTAWSATSWIERLMQLISGGQTGVDRAVLDVAIERGIDYAGWCPKGGWAEDFPQPPGMLAKYPGLNETPLADPAQRTEWNVRDADACMVLIDAKGLDISAGTALAKEMGH